jgi:hypothetical protein
MTFWIENDVCTYRTCNAWLSQILIKGRQPKKCSLFCRPKESVAEFWRNCCAKCSRIHCNGYRAMATEFILLIGNPALICQINIYAFGGPYVANYTLPICQNNQHTAMPGIGCNLTCKVCKASFFGCCSIYHLSIFLRYALYLSRRLQQSKGFTKSELRIIPKHWWIAH